MVGALLLLAATYPKFGFVRRRMAGNIGADREELMRAFQISGYDLAGASAGELRFRARGVRRLTMLFEDEIVVRQLGDEMEFEGIRRATIPVMLSAERFIENKEREDD